MQNENVEWWKYAFVPLLNGKAKQTKDPEGMQLFVSRNTLPIADGRGRKPLYRTNQEEVIATLTELLHHHFTMIGLTVALGHKGERRMTGTAELTGKTPQAGDGWIYEHMELFHFVSRRVDRMTYSTVEVGLFSELKLSRREEESPANKQRLRTFQFHMKLVESDRGGRQIEGYASTRDLDRTGEIVEPGAFAESLAEFMANPVLTYMHDGSNPIGKVTDARIDEVGLFIRAEISETKAWSQIYNGILRAFCLTYEVVEEKVVNGVNHILRLRLCSVAVVSIPANRRALFSVSKGMETGTDMAVLKTSSTPSQSAPQPRSRESERQS